MVQFSSKNDDSSLYYDVIFTHKNFTDFVIFRVISIITVRQTYLEVLSTLYLINVSLGALRTPLVDTKCPPAAQRKQAKRACYI